MEEARLGRWNLLYYLFSFFHKQVVEMEEARLGRWNIACAFLAAEFCNVEMEEARLGRWNIFLYMYICS